MELGDLGNGRCSIVIAGTKVEVDGSADVKETLKSLLQQQGIDSFTILVDGREIDSTDDLPATFGEAGSIEVQRYVKPGLV